MGSHKPLDLSCRGVLALEALPDGTLVWHADRGGSKWVRYRCPTCGITGEVRYAAVVLKHLRGKTVVCGPTPFVEPGGIEREVQCGGGRRA